ncbi:MAG: 30S ribosomal protein S13 [Candidatus Thorarchaeota archaeon]|nr:MAG: 30S ribosomal protein S13 [Candidatus Thorarchaeota archaeon]RLI59105.1 MAG: 30S ribosomal protein S13 [Candidatus Thorarchaeota archaeon]
MSEEYKHIVRIAGSDIDGQESLIQGLTRIRGVGLRISKAIVRQLELNPSNRLGFLTDDDIKKIEAVIKDPVGSGFPDWYVNRPRDRMSGRMLHLIGSDLDFAQRNDVDRLRRIKSWRGHRHSLGLKVRGQHTRTTGRGGMAVGVSRKKL